MDGYWPLGRIYSCFSLFRPTVDMEDSGCEIRSGAEARFVFKA